MAVAGAREERVLCGWRGQRGREKPGRWQHQRRQGRGRAQLRRGGRDGVAVCGGVDATAEVGEEREARNHGDNVSAAGGNGGTLWRGRLQSGQRNTGGGFGVFEGGVRPPGDRPTVGDIISAHLGLRGEGSWIRVGWLAGREGGESLWAAKASGGWATRRTLRCRRTQPGGGCE